MCRLSTDLKFSLITSVKHSKLLPFGVSFAFEETDFHKNKGRETLNRSHNNLNATQKSARLAELLHVN
jgi:hypothetical protein